MRFLRTNTAVIVTVGPFYDKTDGVTIETALTITNERITLTADTDDGAAPTNILDNVTGATSGTANDLNYITGNDAGMMQLELSAANVNRLGRMFLSITDAANHVPVFHEFMVVPALVYDTFFASSGGATFPNATLASTTNITAGTVTTATNVTTVNGLAAGVITATSIAADAITDAKVASDVTIASVTGAVGSVTAGVTVSTNNDKTGYGLSSAAVQAVWDALTSALTTANSIGKKLADWTVGTIDTYTGNTKQTGDAFARLGAPAGASVSADVAAVKTDTGNLVTRITSTLFSGITSLAEWLGLMAGKQTGNTTARTELRATGAGSGTFNETTDALEALRDRGDAAWTTATGFSTHSAADVWGSATRTLTAGTNIALAKGTGVTGFNDLDAAGVRSAVGLASANLDTQLTTIDDFLDTEIAAIKAKTDNLPASPAAVGSAMTLTSGERDSIAAALLDLANGIETSLTLRQAMKLITAASAGELSGAATTTLVVKAANNNGTTRITATVDADGNRSSLALNV